MTKLSLLAIVLLALTLLLYSNRFRLNTPAGYTDPRTQLVWQFCSAGMTDTHSSCEGDPDLYNWQQALQYCAALPGGYWQLPSREQLISLIDWQKRTPAVPDILRANTKNNAYWTATTSLEEPDKAYYVSMFSGHSYPNKKILQVLVRCVRNSNYQ